MIEKIRQIFKEVNKENRDPAATRPRKLWAAAASDPPTTPIELNPTSARRPGAPMQRAMLPTAITQK
ncbi:7892_t:CDS:2 [Acaulospora morrowiae]|uniref:7892_t:CDS:1 n=1 Tax=Acaulospora morrowiae TaxID=94023 RepID=A0A9N9CYR2_9GLOM|nr:7892_t:CDS:2 [Acaulospora morrowiae]